MTPLLRLPGLERRVIPEGKVVTYLLNPDHVEGGPKARFFLKSGFRPDRPEVFVAALMDHPVKHPAVFTGLTPYGRKFAVEGAMPMPNGRTRIIRTIWMLDLGTGVPRLVTAYPR